MIAHEGRSADPYGQYFHKMNVVKQINHGQGHRDYFVINAAFRDRSYQKVSLMELNLALKRRNSNGSLAQLLCPAESVQRMPLVSQPRGLQLLCRSQNSLLVSSLHLVNLFASVFATLP